MILLLESDNLKTDQLQFGFQALSSTTMCTWAVNTVIEYYLNKGKDVYGCSMDCSKAFDMVEWVALFQGLMKKGVKAISIRILMNIYKDQYCDVRWNGKFSHRFPISNGVRQGSVTSPILFSCYVDKLIKCLRESRIGCRIADEYFGVFIYADDIFLLSASRPGLQAMVNTCQILLRNTISSSQLIPILKNLKLKGSSSPKSLLTRPTLLQ